MSTFLSAGEASTYSPLQNTKGHYEMDRSVFRFGHSPNLAYYTWISSFLMTSRYIIHNCRFIICKWVSMPGTRHFCWSFSIEVVAVELGTMWWLNTCMAKSWVREVVDWPRRWHFWKRKWRTMGLVVLMLHVWMAKFRVWKFVRYVDVYKNMHEAVLLMVAPCCSCVFHVSY